MHDFVLDLFQVFQLDALFVEIIAIFEFELGGGEEGARHQHGEHRKAHHVIALHLPAKQTSSPVAAVTQLIEQSAWVVCENLRRCGQQL